MREGKDQPNAIKPKACTGIGATMHKASIVFDPRICDLSSVLERKAQTGHEYQYIDGMPIYS